MPFIKAENLLCQVRLERRHHQFSSFGSAHGAECVQTQRLIILFAQTAKVNTKTEKNSQITASK